jgi:hypothetical protein
MIADRELQLLLQLTPQQFVVLFTVQHAMLIAIWTGFILIAKGSSSGDDMISFTDRTTYLPGRAAVNVVI